MNDTDLIERLHYCWRCMGSENPHREAIREAALRLVALAQKNERLQKENDLAKINMMFLAHADTEARVRELTQENEWLAAQWDMR